jgi:pimeloyl-[acyl-carrier protein] methyl ester esterase
MISAQATTFKFLDRGENSSLVLVPGWASDWRIFDSLDLPFNYLLPLDFSPFTFQEGLLSAIGEYGLRKLSLLGWSLGGFLAAEFDAKYGSYVEELILVSVRRKYPIEDLETIKAYLLKNKKGYLNKFYSRCFHEEPDWDYFRKKFARRYCEEMKLDSLIGGLDYLARAQIRIEPLEKIGKIKIIHGEFDRIVPPDEARELANKLPRAEFIIIKNSGHIPFLRQDFARYIR